ncbi:MAG: hypothetical protein ABWZ57_16795, partial [Mesorhizobium sp.]
MTRAWILAAVLSAGGAFGAAAQDTTMSFFVTSQGPGKGANLGGLEGADSHCQALAEAAGVTGPKTWRAYLSTNEVNAKDRIGSGPWYNAHLQLVANNVAELHARSGDAALFVDERGRRINGQWTGSPAPVEHDILTGSNADGTVLPGMTCSDWTSDSASV